LVRVHTRVHCLLLLFLGLNSSSNSHYYYYHHHHYYYYYYYYYCCCCCTVIMNREAVMPLPDVVTPFVVFAEWPLTLLF
jgi:hypothetical protein